MKKYRINIKTKEFIEDKGNLGLSYYSEDWREATNTELAESLLEEKKKLMKQDINTRKEIELYKNIEYKGKHYFATRKVVENMIGALALNEAEYSWLDIDGNLVKLTIEDLRNIIKIIAEQRSLAYHREAELVNFIDKALTIEEVNSLEW